MKRAHLLFLGPMLFSLAAAGCGGSDTPSGSGAPGPGGGPDQGGEQPTRNPAANAAIDSSVTRVEFAQAWLGAASTPGKCEAHQEAASYDRAKHEATWSACDGGSMTDSSRVLTSDQAARVEASLAAITYVENPPCEGYDGLNTSMTVFHADGSSRTFVKENINCYNHPAAPKLVDTFSLLGSLK